MKIGNGDLSLVAEYACSLNNLSKVFAGLRLVAISETNKNAINKLLNVLDATLN